MDRATCLKFVIRHGAPPCEGRSNNAECGGLKVRHPWLGRRLGRAVLVKSWKGQDPSLEGKGARRRAAGAKARAALAVRFEEDAPVDPGSLLQTRRSEDSSSDLWTILNRVQEHLIRGGASDGRRDRNGRLRTVRALRGIDSKVTLNKALWGLAEQVIQGSEPTPTVSLSVCKAPASPADGSEGFHGF